MSVREIALKALTDFDYQDGAMLRWSSGQPTARALVVTARLERELSDWFATELQKARAEAWDEGHRARGWYNRDTRRTELVWSDNPYRSPETPTGQTNG